MAPTQSPQKPRPAKETRDERQVTEAQSRFTPKSERALNLIALLILVIFAVSTVEEQAARISGLSFEMKIIENEYQKLAKINDEISEKKILNKINIVNSNIQIRNRQINEGLNQNLSSILEHNNQQIPFLEIGLPSLTQDPNIRSIFNLRIFNLYKSFPSSYLLAFSMICAAAIGASITSLRKNEDHPLLSTIMGLISGFVTYIAIKGGKFLFVIQVEDSALLINPYTAVFAALLVGMFTNRSYKLLEKLVDELANRLQEAAIGKKR